MHNFGIEFNSFRITFVIGLFPLDLLANNCLFSLNLTAAPTTEGLAPAISLTDNALNHLNKMRYERNQDLCLRIGVKQGGCSGMSYTMDFEDGANARADDSIIEYNGFVIGMTYVLVLVV